MGKVRRGRVVKAVDAAIFGRGKARALSASVAKRLKRANDGARSENASTTKKLYTCRTNWHWDVHEMNAGHIAFYTSPEAALDDQSCARECGVVEVEARLVRAVAPAIERLVADRAARARRQQRRFEADEKAYIALADEILAFARKRSKRPDIVAQAVGWIYAGLRLSAREKRRRARLRRRAK